MLFSYAQVIRFVIHICAIEYKSFLYLLSWFVISNDYFFFANAFVFIILDLGSSLLFLELKTGGMW